MTINVGDKAPSFSLRNTEKEVVSSEDFTGKPLVVLFFPLAFTSVCTNELCGVRDDKSYYDGIGAQVIGISVDSLFTLEKFKKEQEYNFPLLSDWNKETCRAFGAIYEDFVLEMKGVAKRAAFVIDGNGIVQYAEVLDSAGDLPNFDKIKTTLNNLV
jgi:glutaredoxin-dependent peroxiredoxin|tara:strand:+ start:6038 stop:6508 length:471 start_codon:yes stop_codon:yes gene_type:complete